MKQSKANSLDSDVLFHYQKAWERLSSWLDQNGLPGWDPYDFRGRGLAKFILAKPSLRRSPLRLLVSALFRLEPYFPLATRRMLCVKPEVVPKGVGLLLRAYSLMARRVRGSSELEKAQTCIDWLIDNRQAGYRGTCWGYPFDWDSVIPIPRGTPSAVVSCIIGDGFFEHYVTTGSRLSLEVCADICEFLSSCLNISKGPDNTICFSYTPIDHYQVHNTNLFAAEFLARVGKEIGNTAWLSMGEQAGLFSVNEQLPEGGLLYWSNDWIKTHGSRYAVMDHYHSGFELRAIKGLSLATDNEAFRRSYWRFGAFYLDSYFTLDGCPKYRPNSNYPLDIHCFAEALHALSSLWNDYAERSSRLLNGLMTLTQRLFGRPDGAFDYRVTKGLLGEHRQRIPHIRWGQAWMASGVATVVNKFANPTGRLA